MTGIVFITEEDARYGFSLAGSMQQTITADETEEVLRRTMEDPDVGVVVIDERLLRSIPEKRFAELEEKWFGLLVTLPSPAPEVDHEEDYLQRLIRKALGYHVRLQQ